MTEYYTARSKKVSEHRSRYQKHRVAPPSLGGFHKSSAETNMIFEVSMANHKASVPTAYNNYELESVRKYLKTEEIPTVLHRCRWWVNGFRTSSYIEKLCTVI